MGIAKLREAADEPWWDLSRIGSVASLLSLVLGAVGTVLPVLAHYDVIGTSYVHWYLILLNLSLLISIVFLFWRLARMEKKNIRMQGKTRACDEDLESVRSKYLRAMRGIENVARERTGITDFLISSYRRKGPRLDRLLEHSSSFLSALLTHTKEIFDVHTGDKCCACIKIVTKHDPYNQNEGAQENLINKVQTLKRDYASSAERTAAAGHDRQAYPYKHNTAFDVIYNDGSVDGFWYCNDLEALGESYLNGHQGWRRHYNATAVIAIRNPSDFSPEYIVGYLCIDNFKGGFDDAYCKYILSCFAHTLYYVLSGVTIIKKEEEGGQAAHRHDR